MALVAAYALVTIVVCPALVWSGAVDLPDELLEFGVADLAFWARELGEWRLPAWDPYRLGGMSVFADPACLGPPYPLGWLLPFIPLDWFVLGSWLLHFGIGAAGVHRLARALGGSASAGAGAGVAWLCSTTCVAALVDGQLDMLAILAWLPWAFVAVASAQQALAPRGGSAGRAAARHAAGAGICLGLTGLGSHARFAAFAFLAVAVYAVCAWALAAPGSRPRASRWAAFVTGAIALGVLLCAPVVLPGALEILGSRSAAPPGGAVLVGQALSPVGLTGLVFPRVLVIDERWYHVGATVLLCLIGLRGDRRRWALLAAVAVLVGLGMGMRGPFAWALRPFVWGLYPVETGAAALALPLLAAATGLSLDRIGAMARGWTAAGVALGGGALLAVGYVGASALYLPEITAVHRLDLASLVHGAVAVAALAGVLLGKGRLGPSRTVAAALALLCADGLGYAWRVEAAIPTTSVAPSSWVAAGPMVAGLERGTPPGRLLQLPLTPGRGFEQDIPSDLFTNPGHGWEHDPGSDPTRDLPAEAAELQGRPLRRNGGSGSGWAQIGGRAKVPPMPWTAILQGLAGHDPRRLPPDAVDPERFRALLELLRVRWVVTSAHLTTDAGLARVPGPMPPGIERFAVTRPRPPALLSPSAQRVDAPRDALRLLLDRPGGDAVVLLSADAPASLPGGAGPAIEGEVTGWSPGQWRVQLPDTDGGVLTIAERYHRGWRASDGEGRPLAVYRANLVDVGVSVPAQTRRVDLEFVAPGAGVGQGLGFVGLWMLLGLGVFGYRSAAASATPARQGPTRSPPNRPQSVPGGPVLA